MYVRSLGDKHAKNSVVSEIEVNVFALNKYFPWEINLCILVTNFVTTYLFVIPVTVEEGTRIRFVL